MIKGLVRYILFLLILFVLTIIYDAYPIYLVLIAFGLAGVFSVACGLFASRRLSVSLELPDKVYEKGEDIDVTIRLDNRSIFPAGMVTADLFICNEYYGEGKTEQLFLQVDAHAVNRTTISVKSDYCGCIRVTLCRVRLTDILRLLRFKVPCTKAANASAQARQASSQQVKLSDTEDRRIKRRDADETAVRAFVLPKWDVTRAEEFTANIRMQEAREYDSSRPGDDVSELFDIREYRPGDQIKRVHHNLSLKTGSLLVKEFGLPVDCGARILVDFVECADEETTLSAFDRAIEEFLGMGQYFVGKRMPFYAIWYSRPQSICRKDRIDTEEQLYEEIADMCSNKPSKEGLGIERQYIAAFPLEAVDDSAVVISFGGKEQ